MRTCIVYLRFFLRVLRELVMLDDFSLILSGTVFYPDPSKVLCTLSHKMHRNNTIKKDKLSLTVFIIVLKYLISSYQMFPPKVLSAQNQSFHY